MHALKLTTLILLAALLAGCASSRQYVPVLVTHPSEQDMAKYTQIIIGDISGTMADEFAAGLKQALVDADDFKVIDRSHVATLFGNLRLSRAAMRDPILRQKLEKMMDGSALLTGHMDLRYRTRLTFTDGHCDSGRRDARKQPIMRPCKVYTETAEVTASGSIDVVDVETGAIIRSRALSASAQDSRQGIDARPAPMDPQPLFDTVINANVDTVIKAIASWEETVYLPYARIKDMPVVETGIRYAQTGNFSEAENVFVEVLRQNNDGGALRSKPRARLYWNLALTYEAQKKYDDALLMLQKAYVAHPRAQYLNERQRVEQLREEQKTLQRRNVR